MASKYFKLKIKFTKEMVEISDEPKKEESENDIFIFEVRKRGLPDDHDYKVSQKEVQAIIEEDFEKSFHAKKFEFEDFDSNRTNWDSAGSSKVIIKANFEELEAERNRHLQPQAS